MMANLDFDLLHNALDYLNSAVEYSVKGDTRSLKYAVLHLDASIELLLKARLAKEHWSLIFNDPDKACLRAMKTGDFLSVDIKSALKRLDGITGVNISNACRKSIQTLREHRNRIQHFAISVSAQTVKSLLAFGCNFVLEFCRNELSEDISNDSDVLAEVKERLPDFQEFVQERMASIQSELQSVRNIIRCPYCNQDALSVGDGEDPNCLFCAEKKPAQEVAEMISEGDVRTCPECGNEALALRVLNNDAMEYYCIFCGISGDYEECSSCGRMFPNPNRDPMCPNCWNEMVSKND